MTADGEEATPSGHTPEGGVLVGDASASNSMVLFEDPQCSYCRQFEEVNGPLIATAVRTGELAVEYRMRCFLGPESVRADNALVLAAEAGRLTSCAGHSLRHSRRRAQGVSRSKSSWVRCTGGPHRFGLRLGCAGSPI